MAIKVKYLPTLQNQTFEFTQTSEYFHFTHPAVSKLSNLSFFILTTYVKPPKKRKNIKNLKFMNIKICNLYVRSHTEMYLFIT